MDFMLLVETYGFRASFSPELFLMMTIVAVFYLRYLGSQVGRRGKFSFLLALFVFYFALGGPLNLLGHFWFSIHMLQQSFLYLIVPPLLYVGLPDSVFRLLSNLNISNRVLRLFAHPVFALFLFNGAFSFYHMPVIFDAAMSNYALHNMLHLLLFLSALCVWWCVFTPEGTVHAMSSPKKMGFIFVNGFLLTPACALIIFANDLIYNVYTGSTHLLCLPFYSLTVEKPAFDISWLTPMNDQQLGGVIMKVLQELSYGCILGYIFFQWYRKEKDKTEDLEDPRPVAST
ncbi:cytochrome c oxidase assembly protein [Paenibacillus eucommiae]|uniref:Membrane protein n=1 Tax=Paenibacillus eucommiae TaxID=1355755 RepID=A0ABS4IQ95_9BACL|nr:cytochrome c oxidase assembly protein [Paenibacillus eucommiae]MBP1989732.1 putative membrane protein [Paenibacillus eucommiae]